MSFMQEVMTMGMNELKAKVKADKAFAENFKSVKTPEEAIEVAKKLGYDISLKDFELTELTEEELKAVAGGTSTNRLRNYHVIKPSGDLIDWEDEDVGGI